ncbi:hypothetical protein Q5M85_14780 [Paraclostridium bifermentans]|nr:hypothetical protein [Paraclostridium bifermentans]
MEILGTVRCLENESRDFVNKRLEEIVSGVTKTMGGSYEYEYEYGYPTLNNNNDIVDELLSVCKNIWGENAMILLPKGAMGSEDASYYLKNTWSILWIKHNNRGRGSLSSSQSKSKT